MTTSFGFPPPAFVHNTMSSRTVCLATALLPSHVLDLAKGNKKGGNEREERKRWWGEGKIERKRDDKVHNKMELLTFFLLGKKLCKKLNWIELRQRNLFNLVFVCRSDFFFFNINFVTVGKRYFLSVFYDLVSGSEFCYPWYSKGPFN